MPYAHIISFLLVLMTLFVLKIFTYLRNRQATVRKSDPAFLIMSQWPTKASVSLGETQLLTPCLTDHDSPPSSYSLLISMAPACQSALMDRVNALLLSRDFKQGQHCRWFLRTEEMSVKISEFL